MDVSSHIYNFRAKLQLQVVETQRLLSLELHQFHNLYNAEVVSGQVFCCCEINSDDYCAEKVENLTDCNPLCDIRLNGSVSHCIEPNSCSFSTEVRFDTASIYNFTEKFVFVLSTGISADEVRAVTNICMQS